MIIGIPKELKDKETRVGLIPKWVQQLVAQGHTVYFPKGFGITGGNFKRGIYGCGRADA
ncbi:MAG: hypothetical protein ACLS3F_05745 [Oscillospiraceae bacterium]